MAAIHVANLAPLSEDAILECIASHFSNTHPRLIVGPGDDCALLEAGARQLISSDLLIEDIHFRPSYFTARELGHKALAVNISDIAACGGAPTMFSLCLGLPEWLDMAWLNDFFTGMGALAAKYDMALMGGDLSRSPKIHVSITIFGESDAFQRRGAGQPGDAIFLVGAIGMARIGLCELEKAGRKALLNWPHACRAHLLPQPLVESGIAISRLAQQGARVAMMDLSDGIARDLPRLLGINPAQNPHDDICGAELRIDSAMLHPEVLAHATSYGLDPIGEAIAGGEDYALLGTVSPEMANALQKAVPEARIIGEITSVPSILCNGREVGANAGFDHFASGTGARCPCGRDDGKS